MEVTLAVEFPSLALTENRVYTTATPMAFIDTMMLQTFRWAASGIVMDGLIVVLLGQHLLLFQMSML
jgi:hypothetical protein